MRANPSKAQKTRREAGPIVVPFTWDEASALLRLAAIASGAGVFIHLDSIDRACVGEAVARIHRACAAANGE